MRTLHKYDHLPIPDYALPYLINGDASGLEEEDKRKADEYMQQYYDLAAKYGGDVIFTTEGDEPEAYFYHRPEFGLPCNVVDCVVLIVAADEYPVVDTPDGLQYTFYSDEDRNGAQYSMF